MDDTKSIIKHPFRVVCIDDKDMPWDFPKEQWLQRNTEYIVTGFFKDLISGENSFTLLDHQPEPYQGYKANRFAIMTTFSVN